MDGFVSSLALLTPVTTIDFRRSIYPRFLPITWLMMDMSLRFPPRYAELKERYQIVTCLHTIEHIGLGRYGDPLDHEAVWVFLDNLCGMLESGGRLVLSFPVGRSCVLFNSHRIFAIDEIQSHLRKNGLKVVFSRWLDKTSFEDISTLEINSLGFRSNLAILFAEKQT